MIKTSSNHYSNVDPETGSSYKESYSTYADQKGNNRYYHQERSSHSQIFSSNSNNKIDNFNLEDQVAHMLPDDEIVSLNQPQSRNQSSFNRSFKQSGQESFTKKISNSRMIQSSSYKGGHFDSFRQSRSSSADGARSRNCSSGEDDRPASRLKQNIDELDNLLSDLNSVRRSRHDLRPYTRSPSRGPGITTSSEDYSHSEGYDGHVKKTVSSFSHAKFGNNVYETESSRRNMSSPRHRPMKVDQMSPSANSGLASPSAIRRLMPNSQRQKFDDDVTKSTSEDFVRSFTWKEGTKQTYSMSSEKRSEFKSKSPPISQIELRSRSGSPCQIQNYKAQQPIYSAPFNNVVDTSTDYYKTSLHESEYQYRSSSPAVKSHELPPYPNTSTPSSTVQKPPKRVDELLTDLSHFDSSIKNTHYEERNETDNYRPMAPERSNHDYTQKPDQIYSTLKGREPPAPITYTTTLDSPSRKQIPKIKSGRGVDDHDNGKGSKSGAAVIPICLPLCCGAPCIIM